MIWRPEGWVNPLITVEQSCVISEAKASDIFEAGANAMHQADVSWLIERIVHNDRGYTFNMNSKEWQEFISGWKKEVM